jgi:hypothetical protein
MIAGIVNGTELSADAAQRDLDGSGLVTLHWLRRKAFGGTNIDPFIVHALASLPARLPRRLILRRTLARQRLIDNAAMLPPFQASASPRPLLNSTCE